MHRLVEINYHLGLEGEAKKYANILIRHFGGTKRLKEASYDDLLKVNGIGEQKAKLIKKYLN